MPKQLLLLLLLSHFLVATVNCDDDENDGHQSSSELIVGTWEVDVLPYSASSKVTGNVTFFSDGTFQDVDGTQGNYTVAGDLLTFPDGGDTEMFTMSFEGNDRLFLSTNLQTVEPDFNTSPSTFEFDGAVFSSSSNQFVGQWEWESGLETFAIRSDGTWTLYDNTEPINEGEWFDKGGGEFDLDAVLKLTRQ